MSVMQDDSCIKVGQDQYAELVDLPEVDVLCGDSDLETVLDDTAQNEYRSVVGKIGWVASMSRPDLCHDHVALSTKLGKATARDMKRAAKVVRKLKSDSTVMKFVNLGPSSQWCLEGFGDAGFQSLPDKLSSCGGQVLLISNRTIGKACILKWRSKKLKRVVSSSTAAEALAANDALDELVYMQCLLKEILGESFQIPVCLHTDSANLHNAVIRSTLAESPRLRTDIVKLQESLSCGELSEFCKVDKKEMIADCLTKCGASPVELMKLLRTCII